MNASLRIAIPLSEGKLSKHFGHLESIALVDINPIEKQVVCMEVIQAPPLQPGRLSAWLAELKANLIIACDMGKRAQAMFGEQGIQVIAGVKSKLPEQLVTEYLSGTLNIGDNQCNH